MKQLREDFFSDNNDNQMRRSELGDEFSAMKSRLMEEFMSARPGYYARESRNLPGGDKPDLILSTVKTGLRGSQKAISIFREVTFCKIPRVTSPPILSPAT